MRKYSILTDSGCDLSPETLAKWGVKAINLTFSFPDSQNALTCKDMAIKEFYARMRRGDCAKTASATILNCQRAFLTELSAGKDILYIGMSSGISTTFDTAKLVAEELAGMWKDRKIIVVDSLCASAGLGLAVYLATEKRASGASITECACYVKDILPQLCHWFTVDNLVYLKRGGRISAATAFLGTALQIKPVMHVDDEGHLVNVSKSHGRKNSIRALAAKYKELANDPSSGTYFISHGDCLQDAKLLESVIKESCDDNPASLIIEISPVIGAHSGPGTLALFFLGKNR